MLKLMLLVAAVGVGVVLVYPSVTSAHDDPIVPVNPARAANSQPELDMSRDKRETYPGTFTNDRSYIPYRPLDLRSLCEDFLSRSDMRSPNPGYRSGSDMRSPNPGYRSGSDMRSPNPGYPSASNMRLPNVASRSPYRPGLRGRKTISSYGSGLSSSKVRSGKKSGWGM
ncbi:hypothetical protein V1264_024481 [Littorina saxatilis]|uniref:Uncharacterized protein n=1 Tax=Littorina saxatilis TaxID=31220 RepID=A0AAN9AN45_9CAEN